MPLTQFDPPGFASDLSDDLKKTWSKKMAGWLDGERAKLGPVFSKYFFNELNHPEAATGTVASITWEGFPKHWNIQYPHNNEAKWIASEKLYSSQGIQFRYQDEYLEWRGEQKNGKLVKITFTCEGPEYWEFLAVNDIDTAVKLYRQFTGANVQAADIVSGTGTNKKYNGYNKWNTTDGIIHLTHPANSLGAEVNLGAQAAIVRKNATVNPIADPQTLIKCSQYGVATRFSDPTIGFAVNSFVRQGLSATLNNPIGLYIHKLNTAGIQVPAGYQISDFWKVIRGDASKQMILRAEFSVPTGANFTLEDVIVGGVPLKYGAQIAELIEMVIYGKAYNANIGVPSAVDCGVDPTPSIGLAHAMTTMALEVASPHKASSTKHSRNIEIKLDDGQ